MKRAIVKDKEFHSKTHLCAYQFLMFAYPIWEMLNERCFDNKLNRITFVSGSSNQEYGLSAFCGRDNEHNGKETILLTSYMLAEYSKILDIREQFNSFVCTLLHEMIHQYIYEQGNVIEGHGAVFKAIAESKGLLTTSEYGFNDEYLKPGEFDAMIDKIIADGVKEGKI